MIGGTGLCGSRWACSVGQSAPPPVAMFLEPFIPQDAALAAEDAAAMATPDTEPKSAAEAEARKKVDALREAKKLWQDRAGIRPGVHAADRIHGSHTLELRRDGGHKDDGDRERC